MIDIINEIKNNINESQVYVNELMKKHTTFKIGGPADLFVEVNNIQELKKVLEVSKKYNLPITIIGNGSNVLVKDGGIRGIVIKVNFDYIEFINETTVNVGAGVLLSKISKIAYERELTGIEFASGIPGTIGGAVRMNAGAHNKEIKEIIVSTNYIDRNLEIHSITNEENEFGYRTSRFANNKDEIITSAVLKFKKGNKKEIKTKMEEDRKLRRETQPINLPSAGSSFKRGDNYITAQLIDKCGLKGYNIGDSYVSDLHAGFIVNKGKATAKDVLTLVEFIKNKVYEKFGIKINLEIQILGED